MEALPPGIDPSTVPAMEPPRSDIVPFADTSSRGPTYIAVASVFIGIAAIFVGLRLWARAVIQRKPWWDDLVVIVALLCQAAYVGINIWLCEHGVGKDMWNVYLSDLMKLINPAKVMAALTEPAIGFTKLALLMFYYRIFWPNFSTRIGSLVGMAFISVIYTTLFFLFVFLPTQQTTSVNKSMAILNVFTDVYILALPIPAVLNLHLATRKRWGLVVLFSTGVFCCIMSIVGAYYRWKFAEHGENFTGGLLNVILVNTIECSVGIMCACIPLLPAIIGKGPLTESLFTSLRSLRDKLISNKTSRSRNSTDNFSKIKEGTGGSMELSPRSSLRHASDGSLVGHNQRTSNLSTVADPYHQSLAETSFATQPHGTTTVSQAERGEVFAGNAPAGIAVTRDFRVDSTERSA